MTQRDPTQRFSDRADIYAKHRPGYPPPVLDILREECGLSVDFVVADVGAGTGLLSARLLETGCTVQAVEPNDAMRMGAQRLLGANPRFQAVNGRSEATTLPAASVDLITVAQALHWFEPEPTKREFQRLLKPGGKLAVINNRRHQELGSIIGEVETILAAYREVPEYGKGWWGWDEAACEFYFGPGGAIERTCPNEQILDEEGFLGRWLSQSTIPQAGESGHEDLVLRLRAVFAHHAQEGRVTIPYLTYVHCGCLVP